MHKTKLLALPSLVCFCLFCNFNIASVFADNGNSNVTVVATTQNQLAAGPSPPINNSYNQKRSGVEVGPDKESIFVLIAFAILVGLRLIVLKKQ